MEMSLFIQDSNRNLKVRNQRTRSANRLFKQSTDRYAQETY